MRAQTLDGAPLVPGVNSGLLDAALAEKRRDG